MAKGKTWIITTSGERSAKEVAKDLKAKGFTVDQVMDEIGTITGAADDAVASKLRGSTAWRTSRRIARSTSGRRTRRRPGESAANDEVHERLNGLGADCAPRPFALASSLLRTLQR